MFSQCTFPSITRHITAVYFSLILVILTAHANHTGHNTQIDVEHKMQYPPYVLQAKGKHTATIIYLHGYRERGNNLLYKLDKIREPYMKIICPQANNISITYEYGVMVSAWFDRHVDMYLDIEGIRNMSAYVHSLIDQEVKNGIPSERIILCGFCQGGGIAMYSGITCNKKLGGIMSLSSSLPGANTIYGGETFKKNLEQIYSLSKLLPMEMKIHQNLVTANRNISILQCNVDHDPAAWKEIAEITHELLKTISSNVELRVYPGSRHEISNEYLMNMKHFFKTHAAPI